MQRGPRCWLWTGALKIDLTAPKDRWYGHFGRPRKDGQPGWAPVGAHTVAYELTHGVILKDGEQICHHCDNPPCCRPDHLFKSNHTGNMQDASMKGRLRARPRAQKLTDAECEEIRHAVLNGPRGTANRIAQEKGVSRTVISLIVNGKRRTINAPARPALEQVG